jgi:hypothetical protein
MKPARSTKGHTMSQSNGEKARASIQKRRRTAQRVKDRAGRAAAIEAAGKSSENDAKK